MLNAVFFRPAAGDFAATRYQAARLHPQNCSAPSTHCLRRAEHRGKPLSFSDHMTRPATHWLLTHDREVVR